MTGRRSHSACDRPTAGTSATCATSTFIGGEVHFDATNDGRAGVIAEDGQMVTLDSCIVERGSNSAFDIGFTGVIAGTATGCVDTHGRAARVHTSP
jgi:hypothetical protein